MIFHQSMEKIWLVDGRALARSIKRSGIPSLPPVNESGANWECPQCGCRIEKLEESSGWPGLPIGVKFEPTDIELLDHLAAKCGVGNENLHEYIDVFIPTIDVEQGICSTHPENLPGSRKDGNSFHLFYQTTNAYAKGQRKRRKICNRSTSKSDIRWHKTGKTKAIFKNGVQIGCKKIMVLYGTGVGGTKPRKMDWVMHQYHLGTDEDEKEGEYVVSKIFYRAQKPSEYDSTEGVSVVDEALDPKTPMMNASDPLRPGRTPLYEDVAGDYVGHSPAQESECSEQKYLLSFSTLELKAELNQSANGDDYTTTNLGAVSSNQDRSTHHSDVSGSSLRIEHGSGAARDTSLENTDLGNLEFGSPLYFNLAELYFPCEGSFWESLDWL